VDAPPRAASPAQLGDRCREVGDHDRRPPHTPRRSSRGRGPRLLSATGAYDGARGLRPRAGLCGERGGPQSGSAGCVISPRANRWCEEQDLNLHALRQRNLNPPRLPFRHPRDGRVTRALCVSLPPRCQVRAPPRPAHRRTHPARRRPRRGLRAARGPTLPHSSWVKLLAELDSGASRLNDRSR
jgi:hypothetical protein